MDIRKLFLLALASSFLSFTVQAGDSEKSKVTPKSPNRTPMSQQGKQTQDYEPIWVLIEEDDYFVIPKKSMKEGKRPCSEKGLDKEKSKHKKGDKKEKVKKVKKLKKASEESKQVFFQKKKAELKNMSKPEQDWVLEQAYFVIDTLND